MRNVYIYGGKDGISWTEKGTSTTLSSTDTEWSSGVAFKQHPDSPAKVYVVVDGNDITFTLDGSLGKALEGQTVELEPSGKSDIFLRSDLDGGATAAQGTRWYSGYVQRK